MKNKQINITSDIKDDALIVQIINVSKKNYADFNELSAFFIVGLKKVDEGEPINIVGKCLRENINECFINRSIVDYINVEIDFRLANNIDVFDGTVKVTLVKKNLSDPYFKGKREISFAKMVINVENFMNIKKVLLIFIDGAHQMPILIDDEKYIRLIIADNMKESCNQNLNTKVDLNNLSKNDIVLKNSPSDTLYETLLDEDERTAEEYSEGEKAFRTHGVIERNLKVIKDAKELFVKKHQGRLFCEACGFDFYKAYGDRGKDFIEGHHKKLVSEMTEGEKTRVEDTSMLCSNCHRMIHRKSLLSVEELVNLIKLNGR